MRKVASHLFYMILCLLEIYIIGNLKILPSPVKSPKLEYSTRNDVFQTQANLGIVSAAASYPLHSQGEENNLETEK